MLRIKKKGITFDDVLLIPKYSKILPHNTDLSTQLTKNLRLNIPILSAAMDTVTESYLAISLAQEGGIGFIHKNMSIQNQVNEVLRVKKYKNNIIINPITISPNNTIREIYELIKHNTFSSYPVINKNKELIGIITKRDIRFINNLDLPVTEVMTKKNNLIIVNKGESRHVILKKLHDNHIQKILITDDNNHLLGMITIKDLIKPECQLNACKDNQGCLRVGAAVGIDINTQDRIQQLIIAGIDVLLIDSSHGHSYSVLKCLKDTRNKYPELPIIAGNIATSKAAIALVKAGASAIKVGMGPGSICTTRIVTGVGIPQITAINDVAEALKNQNIPIIADGGIRFSGDIAKAIAAGASCVMIGSIFAGTKESPGEIIFFQGKPYKEYRGMGSLKSMLIGSSDRYFQSNYSIKKLIPEGIEGMIPYKGLLKNVINQYMGGLRSCMGLTGCDTIQKLRTTTEFIRISNAGIQESHVHDVIITKKPPNYY